MTLQARRECRRRRPSVVAPPRHAHGRSLCPQGQLALLFQEMKPAYPFTLIAEMHREAYHPVCSCYRLKRNFQMRDQAVVRGMQRSELARRTGSNLETVRYYEKVGLLPEPPRTAG